MRAFASSRRALKGASLAVRYGASPGVAAIVPQVAAVVVAALLFTLIYAPFGAGAVTFVALAPIALVFGNPGFECTLRRAGVCGFLFGLLAATAIVGPWMFLASLHYFGNGALWSMGFTLAVCSLYVGLLHVPAFVAIRLLAQTPPTMRVIGIASIWTLCETLRAADPSGNVWATLGQGFAHLPILREAASFGGEPLLCFAAALCGAAVGVGLQPDVDALNSRACMSLGVLAVVALAGLGTFEHSRDPETSPIQPLRVAVVQNDIASQDVWNPAKRMEHWNAYVSATESIPVGSVDLVVWPESAVPFLLEADAASMAKIADLAKASGAAILLGAPRAQNDGEGHASLYNSAYFFAPGAAAPRVYDKQRLLPYVEDAPFSLADVPAGTTFKAGEKNVLFDVKGWRIAPLICFEALYAGYARQAVLDGATLLVNLSNDAWFAGGSGPEQHWAMSALRTTELKRPMVRASNGGVSGAIGADGDEIGIALHRRKSVGIYQIPSPSRRTTLAASFPELVPWTSAVLALICLAFALRVVLAVPEDVVVNPEEQPRS